MPSSVLDRGRCKSSGLYPHKFFRSIGKENCEKIEAVASDGAKGYLSSIEQYARNVLIVLDHLHIKKYLNDAVDTVRKEELKMALTKPWKP